MSRTAFHIATVAALSLTSGLFAAPVIAQQAAAPEQARGPAPRVPAGAQERATYDRMDALARSVFWAGQQEINPSDIEAGTKLTQALLEMGANDQAAEAAQRLLVLQPDNVEALLMAGRAHIARGQAFFSSPIKA